MMIVSLSLGTVMAVALIAIVSVLTGGSTQAPNVLDGTTVKSFSLAGLNGGTVRAPWSSGHPAVVVFFASWCGPCKAELPRVAAYESGHALGKVRFVGVDVNDPANSGQAFTDNAGVAFPVGRDPSSLLASQEFQLAGMPDTVFVNSNGTVSNVVIGAVSTTELAADISQLY